MYPIIATTTTPRGVMRHLIRVAARRQRFSTASAAAAATPSNNELPTSVSGSRGGGSTAENKPLLPSRHSRKRLPPVCTDIAMLEDLTDEILQAPEGTLFTYTTDKDSGADAWDAADITCQKVDFLVRGYAARLPGTMWQRWVLPTAENNNSNGDVIIDAKDTEQVTKTLSSMEALLDRIWDEGHAYMTIRADRLQEKVERNLLQAPEEQKLLQLKSPSDEEEMLQLAADHKEDISSFMKKYEEMEQEALEQDFKAHFGTSEVEPRQAETRDEEEDMPFMNDFALPGPTIDTFHTILDAMACNTSSPFVSLEQTKLFYDDIMARHHVDGGDLKNTQLHTAVSALSYNAAIRVAASLPYDNKNVFIRDGGLLFAFEAYDALTHSERCQRNSATFNYILQTVAKYMPPSRNKGNIAAGMFYLAQQEGCVDTHVLDAYRMANTPSNGAEFESWSSSFLNKKIGDLPHAWRRHNKARRHHQREAVY
eukprot:scaffold2205_cov167-Amphora_coffeaeformis.AAC.2